jgi:hypothetical protein
MGMTAIVQALVALFAGDRNVRVNGGQFKGPSHYK